MNDENNATRIYDSHDETLTILDVLSDKTLEQRNRILKSYSKLHSKDLLINMIKNNAENNNDNCSEAHLAVILCHSSNLDLRVYEIYRAIDGAGTDIPTLIDILCTQPTAEINLLKSRYLELHKKDIKKALKKETAIKANRSLKKLFFQLLEDPGFASITEENEEEAASSAQQFYEAGEARLGTDEEKFIEIFTKNSYSQLIEIFNQYEIKYESSIENAIDNETLFYFKDALHALVKIARSNGSPLKYYATRIHDSSSKIFTGSFHKLLNRIIVQCTNDETIEQLKTEFYGLYDKTLESFIEENCNNRNYKTMLFRTINSQSVSFASS